MGDKTEKLSNTALENKKFLTRVIIAFIFVIILTLILIVRVYILQIVNYQYYTEESLGNQMRIAPIAPIRGKIFDRNGKVIATNKLAYKLIATPEKIPNINATLTELKLFGLINDNDIEQFFKNRARYKKFDNIPIKHNLNETQIAKFLVSNKFAGVDIEPYFHRIYPNEDSAVHVIGYVSKMSKKDKAIYDKDKYLGTEFVGKNGIEKQYEELLHGKPGTKQIERNVYGRIISSRIIKPQTLGNDLFLTIDSNVQKKAETVLTGKRGSIIVMNVKNGGIVAMASAPNYNPNWFVGGISHKQYKSLRESKDIPLLNRSIQGLYPPGSTLKPMVALVGLENNVVNKKSKVFCPGYFKLPDYSRKFNDWKRTGHGSVDVEQSLSQSCDVFFYTLAHNMGIDLMHDGLSYFGFGKKTGIDIPNELVGILPSREWKKTNKKEPWHRGETLIVGIGQGFMLTTPLQLVVATAAIANKGTLLTPRLLKNIQTTSEILAVNTNNKDKQIPIKNINNWVTVIDGMKKTIYAPRGTARRINKNLKYTFAGKTGTAQVFGLDAEEEYIAEKYAEHLRDHALFIGFAPIEDPEVAIVVIVENAGSGSSKAAPLARKVLDEYFVTQRPPHKPK